ncbi:Hypothetical predicted protein [Mytilus galloprovincialis]|uniref:Uncharacterized protein n=1 Tax=Mytilus galloprovincialis TaxID=29158 RepID=A0A8B6GUV1_MYTGA|nr:Hypothetical predicted protein [Mytilus galloprovincialis]
MAITIREIILFVVITCFGLLIFGGLAYTCRKRQSRILITQHQEINQHREEIIADNDRSKMQIQLIEEESEDVYDIIDESALSKTLEPSTSRMQNSYLDVKYSPKFPMNDKENLGIICIASVSSQSKMAEKTSLRSQKGVLEESIISCQGALVSAYSDGYLRPRSFEHHTGINKTMEKQGTFCSNKDKVARKENYGYIYDEPAYDGIGRAGNYDSLVFSKDTSNLKNEIVLVQNPIETEQLEINIEPPKQTTSSPKRKTI